MDRRKILIVEDHHDIRKSMVLFLKRAGYHVAEAAIVAEGIAKLDGQAVALLDLNLPDGSGEQVLKHIRQQNHPTKVAIVSAEYDVRPKDLQLAPEAIFRKPVDLVKLLEWIKAQPESL